MTDAPSPLHRAAAKYRRATAEMARFRPYSKRAPVRRAAAEQERIARRELHAAIINAVRGGMRQAEACRISGLSTPHVSRLMRGVSSGRITPPPPPPPFKDRILLPELVQRYRNGETVAALATTYECSTTTIRALLESCGIKRRGRYIQLAATPEELARRYLDGREQLQDLAAEFGVSGATISARLAEAGVRVPLGARRLDLPDAEIAERYRKGETVGQLAAAYGVSDPAIRRRIRDGGHYVKRHPSAPVVQRVATVAVDLYVSGLSGKAVAKRLGVSRDTVRKIVTAAGVTKHPAPEESCAADLRDGPYREIAVRYQAGESTYALAREYGVPRSTLQRRMAALGAVRPKGER